MEKKEYYVYGLIDPRNNEYFYIGKGKGSRYDSHFKELPKDIKNIFKYNRIKEIESENLQVKVDFLFLHLTESTAFHLEKIIIYKIGRESFKEGNLLNFTPGGLWSPGKSLFYETKPNIDFDLTSLDFLAQVKFNSIKKTSSIIHLDEITPKYLIHKYDLDGVLVFIKPIIDFYKDKNMIDLFFEINNENIPIYYAGFIYSKKPIVDFYFSLGFISLNNNISDSFFLEEVKDKLSKKNDFSLTLKQNGFSKIKVIFENKILKIETFFPNNNIQNIQYLKNGKPLGKWIEYYENSKTKTLKKYNTNGSISFSKSYSLNGSISLKSKYYENGIIKKNWSFYNDNSTYYLEEHSKDSKKVSKKLYYANGQKKYSYNNFNNTIEYSYYHECGRLIEEFITNKGFIKYNLEGEIISISSSKHMEFVDTLNVLSTKKSDKNIISQEKKDADKDWEFYTKFLNDHQ
ncbi:LEM-3-like GIY-YIG domain-containing protein [Algibacter lectus]|uniref:GIY-YIG domain-containing protein n=1 Tax=Algibacter lectus TaxID=221126 RepID=A0A4R8MF34_9FLAO|nr:hypothetical protein [Algibacter lectus]MWW25056.1 hypothetical protein [Algibacter lectus]TDY64530.1 hypothetical protein DFQ06_1441 [Algibacter lectus]